MRAASKVGAIACMLASAVALAQPDAGVRIDYQVDGRCAPRVLSPETFIAEVHGRSPRIRISPDAPRSLVVRITRVGPAKMAGRIELHEPDGTTTERDVTGASCEEVVSALSLVAALALDPLASASTASASPTISATTPAEASATTMPTSTKTATVQPKAPPHLARSSPTHDEDEDTKPLEQRRWSVGAGADAEAVLGASPTPMFAVPVFFEATRALGPHVGLGGGVRFERTGETSLVAGSGADFTWTVGALDLCVALRGGRIRFNACLRADAGAIDARGEGVVPERSATRPWVDLGVALALRLRVVGPVFVEAEGQAGVPLVRDRFFLEPDDTVFHASFLTGHVGGGIGFEIW